VYVTSSYDDPNVVPSTVRARYKFLETQNAAAILNAVAPGEFTEFLSVLDDFVLHPDEWLRPGGNKGDLTDALDQRFRKLGWAETQIDFEIQGYFLTDFHTQGRNYVPQVRTPVAPTYVPGFRVDNHKGRMIVDIEWNAKDGNLDRDLAAYRAWYEAGLIDGAVIITKDRKPLLELARRLWDDFRDVHEPNLPKKLPVDLTSSTTTSLDKAEIRILRGEAGTCPVLIIGVSDVTWDLTPLTPHALAGLPALPAAPKPDDDADADAEADDEPDE
jgi:hypothetical protein